MNIYAESIRKSLNTKYYNAKANLDTYQLLPFLEGQKYYPAIELNKANAKDLEALPGIGKITSERIVNYRQKRGPFTDTSQLKRIKGISNTAFSKFKDMIYIQSCEPVFRSKYLLDFVNDPTFSNYVSLLHHTKGSFIDIQNEADNTITRVIRELEDIKRETEQNRFYVYKTRPKMSEKDIMTNIELKKSASKIKGKAVGKNMVGSLIYDSQYPLFVSGLVKQAKSSIFIILFFLKFEKEESYPTYTLIDEILKAKSRGVEVRIILDKDAEGEVFGSRIINDEAFKLFKQNDIDVCYDTEEQVTHTKLILVDNRHVVIGSHNWTAGSFYAYDDTSIYIDSEDLAKDYIQNFKERWNEYNK